MPDTITSFSGDYAWLSNFFPLRPEHRIAFAGLEWSTVEHAYQASKTIIRGEQILINRCHWPGSAKRIGRTVTLRSDWDSVKVAMMEDFLSQKFEDPELTRKLLATGDAKLVEGNLWHDNFWGSCTCPRCANHGQNWLGILLMELRDLLDQADRCGLVQEVSNGSGQQTSMVK
jgi:ribA/ribD-fused uncharacterized protein